MGHGEVYSDNISYISQHPAHVRAVAVQVFIVADDASPAARLVSDLPRLSAGVSAWLEPDTGHLVRRLRDTEICCVLVAQEGLGGGAADLVSRLKVVAPDVPVIVVAEGHRQDVATLAGLIGVACYFDLSQGDTAALLDVIRLSVLPQQPAGPHVAPAKGPLRLLLLEPDPADREMIESILREACAPVDIFGAASFGQARALLEHMAFHCILADCETLRPDGLDAFHAPVVGLVRSGAEAAGLRFLRSGGADVVLKSELSPARLRRAVEKARRGMDQRRPWDLDPVGMAQFLNAMVHDLRGPLQNISATNELALRKLDRAETAPTQHILALQSETCRHAIELLNHLSDYVFFESELPFARVSGNGLIGQVRVALAEQIEARRVDIKVTELPDFWGHGPQLAQLFQNLIQNAIKYAGATPPVVCIRHEADFARTIYITVADNGAGIPQGSCTRVFEPLVRLENAADVEGNGLGLAICDKIARAHGGRIWCTSIAGIGTKFHLVLPLCPADIMPVS